MTLWSLALVLGSVRTLVLPFENLAGDSAQDWRGSAFEEAVSSHLESVGIPVVEFGARNRELQAKGFAAGEPLTRASAIVLAKDLGADRIVFGTFQPDENRIVVTARLIDLNRGATIGVVEDFGTVDAFARLTNLVAKNLLRLERDDVPPAYSATAERRARILPEAVEASALARLSFDSQDRQSSLERALRVSPEYLEARLELGKLLLDEGRAREAIDVLAEAKGTGELYRKAYFELGLAYLEAGEPNLALEVYQHLTEGSEAPACWNNLGVAFMRLDRTLEAAGAFERALAAGGETRTVLFNLAWSRWRSGKGASAMELFEKLAAADPVDAEARFLLAAAASSQAETDLAETSRASALVLTPHLADVEPATVVGLERVMESSDRGAPLSAAEEPFGIEEDAVTLEELFDARAFRARGRREEAIQLLQRSLYRDPAAVDVRRELAEIYREAGHLQQAASELSVLLWSAPSAEGHVELARLFLEMKEPGRASEQIEKALALDPDHGGALDLRSEMPLP